MGGGGSFNHPSHFQMELACTIIGCTSVVYSFSLAILRHVVFEDKGAVDSISNVVLSSTPILFLGIATVEPVAIVAAPILSIFLSIYTYRKYVAGNRYKDVDQTGKVFIVTGSNTGIGYETAKALLKLNATVILACRSEAKANEAKSSLLLATNCSVCKIVVITLDLCDFDSVRSFVHDFIALDLPLHCLINNAGVMMEQRVIAKAGQEVMMTANHLSHFLLTMLLLPSLAKTNGRVVNVTSSLHRAVKSFQFDSERNFSLFGTYGQSKLANILFTFELQRRLLKNGSKVCVNAVHPGVVSTDVARNMNIIMRVGDYITTIPALLFRKIRAQGAWCSVFVAISPELDGVGGMYFFHCSQISAARAAYDESKARELWELSVQLTGLTQEEESLAIN